jgi:hypothetical protein
MEIEFHESVVIHEKYTDQIQKHRRIHDDIIKQEGTGKGKIVIFFNDDGEITNWECVICRK